MNRITAQGTPGQGMYTEGDVNTLFFKDLIMFLEKLKSGWAPSWEVKDIWMHKDWRSNQRFVCVFPQFVSPVLESSSDLAPLTLELMISQFLWTNDFNSSDVTEVTSSLGLGSNTVSPHWTEPQHRFLK